MAILVEDTGCRIVLPVFSVGRRELNSSSYADSIVAVRSRVDFWKYSNEHDTAKNGSQGQETGGSEGMIQAYHTKAGGSSNERYPARKKAGL